MANFVKQLSGCKRQSTVWKYFEQANIRKSRPKCLVPDAKGRIKCGHLVAGKNATNLKAHLSVHHSDKFKDLKTPNQFTIYGCRYTDLVAMEHMWIAEMRHTVTFNCNLRVKLKLKWWKNCIETKLKWYEKNYTETGTEMIIITV